MQEKVGLWMNYAERLKHKLRMCNSLTHKYIVAINFIASLGCYHLTVLKLAPNVTGHID